MGIAIVLSLLTNAMGAQETTISNQKKSLLSTADNAMKRLNNQVKHLKACLNGKELCSKTDFAVLSAGLLFVYGILRAIRRVLPYEMRPYWGSDIKGMYFKPFAKEMARRAPYYLDPGYLGDILIRKTLYK